MQLCKLFLQSLVARHAWKAGFYIDVIESLECGARTSVQRYRRSGIPSPAEVSSQSRHSTVVCLKRTHEWHVHYNTSLLLMLMTHTRETCTRKLHNFVVAMLLSATLQQRNCVAVNPTSFWVQHASSCKFLYLLQETLQQT